MSIAQQPAALQVDPIGQLVPASPEARQNADYWDRMHSPPPVLHARIDDDHADVARDFAREHFDPVIRRLVEVETEGPWRDHSATLRYQSIAVEIAGVTPIYPRLTGVVEVESMAVNWTANLDCVWSDGDRLYAAYTVEEVA